MKLTSSDPDGNSSVFGISVRSFIALLLTGVVCAMALRQLEVKEPLYSAFLLTLGFYFGQKNQQGGGTNVREINANTVNAVGDVNKPPSTGNGSGTNGERDQPA